jgi:hypothetical protein
VTKTLWQGALAGAAIGVVIALPLAVLAFGTGNGWGTSDTEALPGLYLIAVLIGMVVGSVTGAGGLVVAVLVARASKGSPADRRLRGALAAAGCSALISMFTIAATLFGTGLFAMLVVGALGGLSAWLLLPAQLDLASEPRPLGPPAQSSAEPGTQRSALSRGAITVAVAAVGSFVTTYIVMTVISSVAYVKRDVTDVLAIVVLVVAFAAIAVVVWRYLARRPAVPTKR